MKKFTFKPQRWIAKLHLCRYGSGFLLCLLVVLNPSNVAGQELPITVSVNRTHFTTDELVILTVTVVDDSAQQPRPILPPIPGLAVIDLDISTNVSLVNNEIRTEVTYIYQLQPRTIGVVVIPPVTVKIDDQTFEAPPSQLMSLKVQRPRPHPAML